MLLQDVGFSRFMKSSDCLMNLQSSNPAMALVFHMQIPRIYVNSANEEN